LSTVVDFAPSTTTLFSFQAQLADGNQYTIATPWNIFGQRYYLNVADLFGNQIVYRALVASGPSFISSLSWAGGIATAVTSSPHNVPVGTSVAFNVSQTGTAFDGNWLGLSTGPTTLTYMLATNPQISTPVSGSVNFPLNLVAGYISGAWLVFHYETQQFEF
jgi:hypothetical protein